MEAAGPSSLMGAVGVRPISTCKPLATVTHSAWSLRPGLIHKQQRCPNVRNSVTKLRETSRDQMDSV